MNPGDTGAFRVHVDADVEVEPVDTADGAPTIPPGRRVEAALLLERVAIGAEDGDARDRTVGWLILHHVAPTAESVEVAHEALAAADDEHLDAVREAIGVLGIDLGVDLS